MLVVYLVESLIVQVVIDGFVLSFAAIAGAVGIGGGGLFIPVLLIIGGFSVSQAIPIASAAIFGVGLASTLVNQQNHTINYKLALTLEPFTIIGTIIGVQIFLNIPEMLIMLCFVILMIFLSVETSRRARKLKNGLNSQNEKFEDILYTHLTSKNTIIAIVGSACAGIISSIVGIGGGLIKVPMLSELGLSSKIACGTGSFMVLFTSLSTTTQFIVFNQLDLNSGVIMFSLGFIGSILGTFLSRHVTRPYFLHLMLAFTIGLSTIFIIGEAILGLLI